MATTSTDFSSPFLEKERTDQASISYDQVAETPEALKPVLDEFGFVIITDLWDDAKRAHQHHLLFEDLLAMVDKGALDPQTSKAFRGFADGKHPWPKASTPGICDKGFFTSVGTPQCLSAWTARADPRVRECFAILHGVPPADLVVGTDVFFYSTTTDACTINPCWAHADQNTALSEAGLGSPHSYQGILYVDDGSLPTSAQTIVWPGSHKDEIYCRLQASVTPRHTKDHSLYLERIHDGALREEFYEGWRTHARRLPVPAGALMIFNSKTIHQGYNGFGQRLAYPISWEPRYFRNEEALKSKLLAVVKGIATTHWASLGIHHGASKVKPKRPSGSKDPAKCVLPLRPLRPYPVLAEADLTDLSILGRMSLTDLKALILPEILELL